MKRAGEAVRSIVANKDALSFTDDAGDVVTGRLPRTLDEFSQAVEQTKTRIFQQYDDMARAAGQEGATVNLAPIADDLSAVAGRPGMQDQATGAARYAAQQAETLANRGVYTAQEAQEALRVLNSRLDAFYKNPTPNMTQRAYIDSITADRLRQALDDTITNATGAGYQALKNQYGALKSVEREVNHRAVVANRQSVRSLTDFISDMAALGHTTRAIMAGDPASAAAGVVFKAANRAHKAANSPNRIISKMFEDAERIIAKQEVPPAWATTAQRIAQSRGVPKTQRPPTPEEQVLRPGPYDAPTFQRQGRQLSPYEEILARGHTPYEDPNVTMGGQLGLPRGAGFQAEGVTPPMVPADRFARGHVPYTAVSPAEESARVFRANLPQTPAAEGVLAGPLGQGHRPVMVPEPPLPTYTKSAADSARVFEGMPSQTPAADRAGAFVGPNEMLRRSPAGQSAAVFEEAAAANKMPQAMDALWQRIAGAKRPVGAAAKATKGSLEAKEFAKFLKTRKPEGAIPEYGWLEGDKVLWARPDGSVAIGTIKGPQGKLHMLVTREGGGVSRVRADDLNLAGETMKRRRMSLLDDMINTLKGSEVGRRGLGESRNVSFGTSRPSWFGDSTHESVAPVLKALEKTKNGTATKSQRELAEELMRKAATDYERAYGVELSALAQPRPPMA
jgi:hypothetical protein